MRKDQQTAPLGMPRVVFLHSALCDILRVFNSANVVSGAPYKAGQYSSCYSPHRFLPSGYELYSCLHTYRYRYWGPPDIGSCICIWYGHSRTMNVACRRAWPLMNYRLGQKLKKTGTQTHHVERMKPRFCRECLLAFSRHTASCDHACHYFVQFSMCF